MYSDAFTIEIEGQGEPLHSEVQLRKMVNIVTPLTSIFLLSSKNHRRITRQSDMDNDAAASNSYGGGAGYSDGMTYCNNRYIIQGEGFLMVAIVFLTGILLYLTSSSPITTSSSSSTTPSTTTMKGNGRRRKRRSYDEDEEYEMETIFQATINKIQMSLLPDNIEPL